MRGGAAPSALPEMQALRPAPGVFCGTGSPSTPNAGAPPCTRVTFPSRGKSPKARQGLRPLESPGAGLPPFSRSLRCAPSRAGLSSATTKGRFATLGWWANGPYFLPKPYRGNTSCCQSVARQVFCLRINCPELHPFLGGAALAAAGGMIMPPKGVQGACPLTRLCLLSS